MKSKRKRLAESYLYVIIDKEASNRKYLTQALSETNNPGIDIVQLRDKKSPKEDILENAWKLRSVLARKKILFIVNDHIDVAKISDSDGLHLGQSDISVKTARRILGKDKIIGVSCHTLKQAQRAQKLGADYISIGPIFPTPVKPDYKATGVDLIKKIKDKIKIPFYIIGGINKSTIGGILSYGVKRVAICRALNQAKTISETIKSFR